MIALNILTPDYDDSYSQFVIVAGAAAIVLVLIHYYLISAKQQRELSSRAKKLGFRVVENSFKRRFAVPISAVLLEQYASLAYPRTAPVIRCPSCDCFIEPGHLIGTCADCSRVVHVGCMVNASTCKYCDKSSSIKVWDTSPTENEIQELHVLDADYFRDHYVENGIPLERPDEEELELGDGFYACVDAFY